MKKYIGILFSLLISCSASAMLRSCARMMPTIPKAIPATRYPHTDAIDPDLQHKTEQEEVALRMQILLATRNITRLEEQTKMVDFTSYASVLAINPALCTLDYLNQLPGGSSIAGTLIAAIIASNVCVAHKTRAALWRLKHLQAELFWVQKCGAFEKQLKRRNQN